MMLMSVLLWWVNRSAPLTSGVVLPVYTPRQKPPYGQGYFAAHDLGGVFVQAMR
jgi:hypothetical protein